MEVNENVKSIQYIPAGIAVTKNCPLIGLPDVTEGQSAKSVSSAIIRDSDKQADTAPSVSICQSEKSAIIRDSENNPRFRQKTPNLQPINQRFPTKTIDNSPQVVIYFLYSVRKVFGIRCPLYLVGGTSNPDLSGTSTRMRFDLTTSLPKIRVIRVIRENPRFRK